MLFGKNVLKKIHEDDDNVGHEPTQSGIFLKGERSPLHTANRRYDAGATLDWLERRLAPRYEGDAALVRLARINDTY
jgi:hypothetical protein